MPAASTDSIFHSATSACQRGGLPDCRFCPEHVRCLVRGTDAEILADWQRLMLASRMLRAPGTDLFATGETADTLYVVRSRCIKTCSFDRDGCERVRALHLPGDVLCAPSARPSR